MAVKTREKEESVKELDTLVYKIFTLWFFEAKMFDKGIEGALILRHNKQKDHRR